MTIRQFLIGMVLFFTAVLCFTAGALYQLDADRGIIAASTRQKCG